LLLLKNIHKTYSY